MGGKPVLFESGNNGTMDSGSPAVSPPALVSIRYFRCFPDLVTNQSTVAITNSPWQVIWQITNGIAISERHHAPLEQME